MDAKEMSVALKIKRTALFSALRAGVIPAYKKNGKWYISEERFNAWILNLLREWGKKIL